VVESKNGWNLFFEFFNNDSNKGEIGVAESKDLKHWKFLKPALVEPFHLSYPFVFKHQSDYFMIPETRQAQEVRLYRASTYPTEWKFDRTLIKGNFADSSLVHFQYRWWLFTCESPYSLHIYYAEELTGPWTPHALNPIYKDDSSKARPGGRPIVFRGSLIRFVQGNTDGYGRRVRAMVVDELTPSTFREHPFTTDPLLGPHGEGWARQGMHHVAPWPAANGSWVISIDGSGDDSRHER